MKKIIVFFAAMLLSIPAIEAQIKSKPSGRTNATSIYKDALIFDLKGPVKSCKWEGGESSRHDLRAYTNILYFNKSGAITNKDIKVERDGKNRISTITEGESYIFLSYNKDGRVQSMGYGSASKSTPSKANYEYDKNGKVIKALDFASSNLFSDEPDNVIEFKYTKYDKHGNWTERKYEISTPIGSFPFVERRIILYYP